MAFLFEVELRQRAEAFIQALKLVGIQGAIVPNSYRDYTVKVAIRKGDRIFGNVNLYYSPTKSNFSLKLHELKDKSVESELWACWESAPAASSTIPAPAGYHVYVDGSCVQDNVGFGVVILRDGDPVAEHSGRVSPHAVQGMWQVAGEIEAVCWALDWCNSNQAYEITLFYDYEGIEKWATGEWQANKPATQTYAQFVRDCPVTIHWHKVDSHTGNRWNDHADRLAAQAISQEKIGAPTASNSLEEIKSRATAFIKWLRQHGIHATDQGLFNNQFGRIVVSPRGNLDIYNTRNRPLSKPYLHGFSDSELKERVEHLWHECLANRTTESKKVSPKTTATLLSEAAHYYTLLKPYADCDFDFLFLAQALRTICQQLNRPTGSLDELRYDFKALESLCLDLQNFGSDRT